MTDETMPDFIIIDDDHINNMICCKIIEVIFPGKIIKTYPDPEDALQYIRSSYGSAQAKDAILFLDINMPFLTGWDVLNEFHQFPESIKQHFTIYMLSSSSSITDKERANANAYVAGYIEKPMTQVKLREIFSMD